MCQKQNGYLQGKENQTVMCRREIPALTPVSVYGNEDKTASPRSALPHRPSTSPASYQAPNRYRPHRLADCHPPLSVFPPLGIQYQIHPHSAIPLQHSKHSNASHARHAAQLYERVAISSVLPPLVRGLTDGIGLEGRERVGNTHHPQQTSAPLPPPPRTESEVLIGA